MSKSKTWMVRGESLRQPIGQVHLPDVLVMRKQTSKTSDITLEDIELVAAKNQQEKKYRIIRYARLDSNLYNLAKDLKKQSPAFPLPFKSFMYRTK